MEFGDILAEWEKMERERARHKGVASIRGDAPIRRESPEQAGPEAEPESARPRSALETWLDDHEIQDKDKALEEGRSLDEAELRARREERDRRFAAMAPQASIDLHGLGAQEAEAALRAFLEDAGRRGLEKVLVIHGKGNHSSGEPILGRVARKTIEKSPWAGRSGEASRALGGSGALWVAIRKRKPDEGEWQVEDYFSR